ncbi:hypothetical protein CPB84DRAFT_1791534 [Gymnopilus junonius]|uniref:Uncharacterized protein n=1 Tax=Gymnopilus junonius TaxID=109634 RepID=A0A9P5NCA1_GYMJU|nr:hypothetical protein CPB84DRAFT_1791534 [Gymnopilus junonius]
MLNPPLSFLSDDLFVYIVEHVATLPFNLETLCNLSLADRAFTQPCQRYIFRTLELGDGTGTKKKISQRLEKIRKILNSKPSIANYVRVVELAISRNRNVWLINHSIFVSILQLLAKSPMPPYELHFKTPMYCPLILEDPVLVVERLTQSFFSNTLTILHLTGCNNVPLPLFLVCPKLKEVLLDHVGVADESYDLYPEKQIFDRGLPALEFLNYRDSQSLVKQMITPPLRFSTPVITWSKLRVLILSPHEKEELICLQPILNVACDALEELHLTGIKVGNSEQLPLSGLVDLSHLPSLHVFALYAIITCGAKGSAVLHDINTVLRTIPACNKVTNLTLDYTVLGEHPFEGCLDQDWVGLCSEIIRIAAGKPLELDLMTTVSTGKLTYQHPGEEELYVHIMKKAELLSDHSRICTHFWNPTCWTLGQRPLPTNQVRSRCKQ